LRDHPIPEDEINLLCEKVFQAYFSMFTHRRSYKSNYILNSQTKTDKETISKKIETVRNKDKENDGQRTEKWYETRYNVLSASSIWKALGTESSKNALIYEKCQPCKYFHNASVNLNSPLHWGQIYEPLAQTYYEVTYDAKIEEFGCIKHDMYNFLGASPDGINVKPTSKTYGRMLEIKSVVSREITGIPKKEYWIQTQLQMECCDLDECDFLECKFEEYPSFADFVEDSYMLNVNTTMLMSNDETITQPPSELQEQHIINKTRCGEKYKGVIMCFMNTTTQTPIYEYSPFQIESLEKLEAWEEETMKKYIAIDIKTKNKSDSIVWVQNRYWKMEKVSCVLICRNRQWFNHVLPSFKELWETILLERVEGYDHRQPKGRKNTLNGDTKPTPTPIQKRNEITTNSNTIASKPDSNIITQLLPIGQEDVCKESTQNIPTTEITNKLLVEDTNTNTNTDTDTNTDTNIIMVKNQKKIYYKKQEKKQKPSGLIINIQT
jgi:putative phage-type endonuclease